MPTGYNQGTNIALDSEESLERFISLLARPGSPDAVIQGDDGEDGLLVVHVAHGFGYLAYYGSSMFGHSVGEPASPALAAESEAGWPAGSGVPLTTFRATLVEFIQLRGQVPQAVRWQPKDP
ncbi:Imm1 family immunity protein [Actinomadura rugatobispora]|uniref:Imm1 family immunity protein n=1 Tax=Actinomadura rugatobispora TaxID=1994 RepID=A0ABW1A9R3_9ACTN